ncbi:MAG: hypothetical protein ACLFO2_00510 [Candidatus Woesearchaeota archaeon]
MAHRSDKRGLVVSTFIKFIIALAFLALLTSILFIGPAALYNRIKAVFPDPNEYLGNDGYQDPKYDARPEQDNAVEVFNEVHQAFVALAGDDADQCLYYLPRGLPYKSLKKHKILVQPVDDGLSLQLLFDREDEGDHNPITDPKKVDAEGDLSVGVVYSDESSRFYYNYLDEKAREDDGFSLEDGDCHSLGDGDLEITYEELRFADEEEEWETEKGVDPANNQRKPGRYVIYKSGDSICLIPTVDGWGNCKVRKNRQILDDDCFQEGADDSIYEQVPSNEQALVWDPHAEECQISW